jgi:hypothetical protein
MRTALIAALKRTSGGILRAELPLAGRSVLARQVDLLRAERCERVLCLCERVEGEVLRLQQEVEAAGITFQALRGFLHLPALIRAEDELVILADGLLPDPAIVADLFAQASPPRFVAALPAASPLVAQHPDDYERIDALHHWAGLLVMRGAPVQHLADFPPDADAISLLLRLALQAGTPRRDLPGSDAAPAGWLLATGGAALAEQEEALVARAVGAIDWRKPSQALARIMAGKLAPDGIEQGPGLATLASALLLLGGVGSAFAGWAGTGALLAACGALSAALGAVLGDVRRGLLGTGPSAAFAGRLGLAVDGLAALALLFALAPSPLANPLGVLGPITIGLARLVLRERPSSPAAPVADRFVLLAILATAAFTGFMPQATALLALLLLGGLLLRAPAD